MTFLEKTGDARRLRHWDGDMEADYIYTAGIAGERFFRALRKDGTLVTAQCERCGIEFLPPRIYCERCLTPVKRWGQAPPTALVESFTVARLDLEGRRLPQPEVWALVRFEGVEGGFVHRVLSTPEKVRTGLRLRPVIRPAPERTGKITDILGFQPA